MSLLAIKQWQKTLWANSCWLVTPTCYFQCSVQILLRKAVLVDSPWMCWRSWKEWTSYHKDMWDVTIWCNYTSKWSCYISCWGGIAKCDHSLSQKSARLLLGPRENVWVLIIDFFAHSVSFTATVYSPLIPLLLSTFHIKERDLFGVGVCLDKKSLI